MDYFISDGTLSILYTMLLTAGVVFGINSCAGNGKIDSTFGGILLVSLGVVGFWYFIVPYFYKIVDSTIG